MALRSIEEAFAENTARANCDFGLRDVIAGTQRVCFWIEEDQLRIPSFFLKIERL